MRYSSKLSIYNPHQPLKSIDANFSNFPKIKNPKTQQQKGKENEQSGRKTRNHSNHWISRKWKDNFTESYSQREAWEETCCDRERVRRGWNRRRACQVRFSIHATHTQTHTFQMMINGILIVRPIMNEIFICYTR